MSSYDVTCEKLALTCCQQFSNGCVAAWTRWEEENSFALSLSRFSFRKRIFLCSFSNFSRLSLHWVERLSTRKSDWSRSYRKISSWNLIGKFFSIENLLSTVKKCGRKKFKKENRLGGNKMFLWIKKFAANFRDKKKFCEKRNKICEKEEEKRISRASLDARIKKVLSTRVVLVKFSLDTLSSSRKFFHLWKFLQKGISRKKLSTPINI